MCTVYRHIAMLRLKVNHEHPFCHVNLNVTSEMKTEKLERRADKLFSILTWNKPKTPFINWHLPFSSAAFRGGFPRSSLPKYHYESWYQFPNITDIGLPQTDDSLCYSNKVSRDIIFMC